MTNEELLARMVTGKTKSVSVNYQMDGGTRGRLIYTPWNKPHWMFTRQSENGGKLNFVEGTADEVYAQMQRLGVIE